jgi:hypothetical protein
LAGLIQSETGSAFGRIEYRLDELIAHYVSRHFKGATPSTTLKGSWKLLGQGFLTFFLDILYTYLIVQIVWQTRFWILLVKSPFVWWRERRAKQAAPPPAAVPPLPEPLAPRVPLSITEETTERLPDYAPPRRERA